MAAPAVSVIIPACNAHFTIARTVHSLRAQTLQDWEAIIIADDLQDYETMLASDHVRDPRLRFASTGAVASGVSRARNRGLALATAPIIALLDADDVFYPEKLARMVPLAQTHGICASPFRYVEYTSSGPRDIGVVGIRDADALLTPDEYLATHYTSNAMLVFDKTRILTPWREDLEVMEDLVFSLSAYNAVPAIYHCNDILHQYVYSPNSLSTSPQAPERFIAAKRRILSLLETHALGVDAPQAAQALRRFVEISLEVEKQYALQRKEDDTVTFTELLTRRLRG
jgi:glycosyltransferase involved in cell wall biosynthesis